MRIRKVSTELQSSIKKYIEYAHNEEKKGFKNGNKVLNCLSEKYREEIKINIYSKFFNENKIFKENFSDSFISRLSLKITELTFTPDEKIFNVYLFLFFVILIILER